MSCSPSRGPRGKLRIPLYDSASVKLVLLQPRTQTIKLLTNNRLVGCAWSTTPPATVLKVPSGSIFAACAKYPAVRHLLICSAISPPALFSPFFARLSSVSTPRRSRYLFSCVRIDTARTNDLWFKWLFRHHFASFCPLVT